MLIPVLILLGVGGGAFALHKHAQKQAHGKGAAPANGQAAAFDRAIHAPNMAQAKAILIAARIPNTAGNYERLVQGRRALGLPTS